MVRKLVQDLPIKVRKNTYTKLNLTGSFEIKKNRGACTQTQMSEE